MLALPPCTDPLDLPVVVHGYCLVTRRFESAGRSFFSCYEQSNQTKNKKNHETVSSTKPTQIPKQKTCQNPVTSANHLKRVLQGPNLYTVLNLDEACSSESIRKRYYELALVCHPDKDQSRTHQSLPEVFAELSSQDAFLLLQDAYETLINPSARLHYDSSLPFDDTIPTAKDINAEIIAADHQIFFRVFDPIFKRNAKWSKHKPVEMLGTMDSPYDQVIRFYTFWWQFESIRSFCVQDEFDLTEAECREQRRWMEKQNQKGRKKHAQLEHERISKLTDLAHSLDPRIIRNKEEKEKLKKEKKKSSDTATSTHEKTEHTLIHQKAEHEQLQQQKLFMKRCRQKLRALLRSKHDETVESISDEDITLFVSRASDLDDYIKSLESIESLSDRICEFRKLHTLHKEPLSNHSSNTSTQASSSSHSGLPDQPLISSTWTPEEINLFKKALIKYPRGTLQRWDKIGAFIGTKTTQEIMEKHRMIFALPQQSTQPQATKLTDVQEKAKSKLWTIEQQKKFEEALLANAALPFVDECKWQRVAAGVPGKTPQECKQRFLKIRQAIQKQKAT